MTGDETSLWPTPWPSFPSSASSKGRVTFSPPCSRSIVTGRLRSKRFAGMGPKDSPSSVCMARSSRPLGDALPLDQSLILLRVNAEYIDKLLQTHRPETVAGHLRHVAAAGLTEAVGGSPEALRLIVEYGERGERALKLAGPDAADVVFGDFTDPTLRRQAADALAAHGAMALAMLDKYASDPDFREILRTHGAAVIPPIAQADAGPEALAYLEAKTRRSFTESLALAALFASGDNGQATIRTIKNDGLERVAQLNQSGVQFYQFLPLYDVIHLGNVRAAGLRTDLGRDDLGGRRRLFRDHRRLEPGGSPARGSRRRRVGPRRGQGRRPRGSQNRGPRAGRKRQRVSGKITGPPSGPEQSRTSSRGRNRDHHAAAGAMVGRAVGGRDVPGPAARPRGTAAAQPGSVDAKWQAPSPQRPAAPEHLAADPAAQGRCRGRLAHPAPARLEIPRGAGRPGRRRRGRISEDGRTSGLEEAPEPAELGNFCRTGKLFRFFL